MPTRRTATLLTIMRPERGHGTEAQSLSRDSAGLRRYKSQSAILYWIRRRRRRWRESCAGRSQERTPAGPGESGQNTTMGGLPSSIAPGDAVAWRDRDQLGSGPSLSAADQGRVIGWDEDTPPSCYLRRGLSSPGAAGASTR